MVVVVGEIEGTAGVRGENTGAHNTTQHSLQLRMIIRWDTGRAVSIAVENFRELVENKIFVEKTFANLW